jgi:MFS transporter, NNP family, nitrate/nitrite transporter
MSAATGEVPQRPSREAYVALVLATLAFTLCFAVWGLIAPLAPQFQQDYGLSNTQISVVIATPVILGSLFRIPMGLLTDRFGGRKVFTALMLVVILPAAGIGFLGGSFAGLIFWGFLLGIAGSSFAVGIPYVSKWFPPHTQGFALGIYGVGNAGNALAAYSAPSIAAAFGWQWAFWIFIIPLVVLAAVFWFLGQDAPVAGPRPSLTEGMSVFKQELVPWVLALFYFLTFGGFVALGIYLPTLLVNDFGLEASDAGLRAAGFIVLATLSRPVGGLFADRIGGSAALTLIFAPLPILAIVLAFGPGMVLFTIAMLTIAALLGLGNGAVFKLVAEYYPRKTGAVTGVVGAAGGLGGFFPPLLMGAVRDATGSYAIGFALLAVFAAACLAVNLLVLKKRPSEASLQSKGA